MFGLVCFLRSLSRFDAAPSSPGVWRRWIANAVRLAVPIDGDFDRARMSCDGGPEPREGHSGRSAVCLAAAILCATAGCQTVSSDSDTGQFRLALSHDLPELDGDHLKVSLVEVTYAPGDSSSAHSHPCPVFGYVVEGALRMQVDDQPERIHEAGESFYEAPNGAHRVSANASDTKPVKFIAAFLCDRETPLSVAMPES